MPASSQASSELSTASLTAVRRAFLGLSKPSRCLFFAKNSLTDMSRCFAAIDSAVTARRFGCSAVSLTLGIFVRSSILPDLRWYSSEADQDRMSESGDAALHTRLGPIPPCHSCSVQNRLGYHVRGCPRGQSIAMSVSKTVN